MRYWLQGLAFAASFAVIAISAKFGFDTSDNELAGYQWGFVYGLVSAIGLYFFVVALRLRRYQEKWLAIIVFAVGFCGLAVSLSNSLGAMAGRMNATQAERMKIAEAVRSAKRNRDAAQNELDAIVKRDLKPALQDDADTSRTAYHRLDSEASAECKEYEGPKCIDKRKKAAAEKANAEELSARAKDTARKAELGPKIAEFQKKVDEAGVVLEANSQGNALARLFNVDLSEADRLTTIQNLIMAALIELAIAAANAAAEVLRRCEAPEPAFSGGAIRIADNARHIDTPAQQLVKALDAPAPQLQENSAPAGELTPPAPKQRKSKGVGRASKPVSRVSGKPSKKAASLEIGSIGQWFDEQVTRSAGSKIRCGLARASYEAWCERHGKAPMSPVDFGKALKADKEDGGFGVGFENISNRASYIGITVRPALAIVAG